MSSFTSVVKCSLPSIIYIYIYIIFYDVFCVKILDCACHYRQKLRRLEVALIEYRESLEERGIKSSEEIEKKVATRRKQLQSEYGLLHSNEDSSANSKCSFCWHARLFHFVGMQDRK